MTHDEIYGIITNHVFPTDTFGGSKLASWRYGYEVCVGGIDEAADEILRRLPMN